MKYTLEIHRYLHNELTPQEKVLFEVRLITDQSFEEMVDYFSSMLSILQNYFNYFMSHDPDDLEKRITMEAMNLVENLSDTGTLDKKTLHFIDANFESKRRQEFNPVLIRLKIEFEKAYQEYMKVDNGSKEGN